MLAVILALVSACGGGGDENAKPAAVAGPTVPQDRGEPIPANAPGVFTYIATSDANNRDPQAMSWSHDIRRANSLFDPLVRLDYADMSIHPATAERWDISGDGLTYTFHLRGDARWSNGDPVTAGDYLYAWRRALMPDSKPQYGNLFAAIHGASDFTAFRTAQLKSIAGQGASPANDAYAEAVREFNRTVSIKAPDDRTLVVTLDRPVPYFLDLVAFATFFPNHAKSIDAASRIDSDTGMFSVDESYWQDPERLVSNGPYLLKAFGFRQHTHMLPNPYFYDRDSVENAGLREQVIQDPNTALAKYDAGEADALLDVPSAGMIARTLATSGRSDVHRQREAGTYFYNYNCRPTLPNGGANPLADPRVRRALSLALDRGLIADSTGVSPPVALSYIPPDAMPAYEPPTQEAATLDVEAARRLLADAGYPQGKGFPNLKLAYATDLGHEGPANLMIQMWRQNLNLPISADPINPNDYGKMLREGKFDIARASWFGDYPDPTTWLDKMRTGDGNNDCGWSNPEYDALLARARGETDPAQRLTTLRQAEAIIQREQPMAVLFQYVGLYVFDEARVKGLALNAWKRVRLENVKVK